MEFMQRVELPREDYDELRRLATIGKILLEDISARADKYLPYSYQEVQMLRELFARKEEEAMPE